MNPRLLTLTSALLFSTGGAAIKATTLTSWQVGGFRSLVAALTIAVILPGSRRNWTWRTLLVGLFYGLCLVSFVLATKNTTSANAIFLQGTAPIYLVILGPWLLGEKNRSADWATLALILVGMAGIFWQSSASQRLAPDPALGNFYGAFSGVAWAATVCGLRWLGRSGGAGRETDPMSPVLAGNLIAFALCAPMLFPVQAFPVADVLAIFYLGTIQIGVAYWLLTKAIQRLSALEASLLIMLEPALNPLWTWLLHDELPSSMALAGGGLIVGATFMKSWQSRNNMLE
ncbi:DMT family transporter [Bryobacter aggregatus]|uniref:DMT family transporter n=1 Tax=Bryobacter aggregatus TaxID=360054 RepID=UPI0004E218A1|nr:DMT family transporter [Bryobacter aggregatus]